MEEIARQQDHIHILLFRQAHNLVKCLPAVILPLELSLCVAHMIVGGHQDLDGISCEIDVSCKLSSEILAQELGA